MADVFRVPVAESYVSALGRAAFNFSYLEWGVVWLAETLAPGFVDRVAGMTAGTISREFKLLTDACADRDANDLQELASVFSNLVKDRNALLHGVPYTASGGEQRLLHLSKANRRDWTENLILGAARKFEAAAIRANQILHAGRYQDYIDSTGRTLSI